MGNVIYEQESFEIINKCMEVHKFLGMGFREQVYKDSLAIEFLNSGVFFEREKMYDVQYKGIVLKHKYFADFVVFDKIILEIKSASSITDEYIAQAYNYLRVSGNQLALIVNFGETSLRFKRIVLFK
jgi:GxxExxY protein